MFRPRLDTRPAPALRRGLGPLAPGWERPPSLLGANSFKFLNIQRSIASRSDWNDSRQSRLWIYNAHYFDDLRAAGANDRTQWQSALVDRWIDENEIATSAGWEPYPLSLRIVNWIAWDLRGRDFGCERLDVRALQSLATQIRCLMGSLEVHLLGNHLLANAKALVFGGLYFSGEEADRWLQKGLRLLWREVPEQILPDGGHYERSPMYHAIVLTDLLDILNVTRAALGGTADRLLPGLNETICKMLRWLRVMTHPDGEIAQFNDSAFGIAPCYTDLKDYARRLEIPVADAPLDAIEPLPNSGYVRLANDSTTLICDVAAVGPDYLPAHAHADTLSFELSLATHRFVVNGGTSTYTSGAERGRQRGTAAHSTVEVDGRDSSEVWSAFRVARRARPFNVRWGTENSSLWLEGAHDGYRLSPTRVFHQRRWALAPRQLEIQDRLLGPQRQARALFHLHPDVAVVRGAHDEVVTLTHAAAPYPIVVSREPAGRLDLIATTWHPEFGLSVDTSTVVAAMASNHITTRFNW